jgi:hypothetical protein
VWLFSPGSILNVIKGRQPVAAMGRIAVSLLLRLLEHRRGEGMSIELQTRLIVRDSTAAPGPTSNREGELAVG